MNFLVGVTSQQLSSLSVTHLPAMLLLFFFFFTVAAGEKARCTFNVLLLYTHTSTMPSSATTLLSAGAMSSIFTRSGSQGLFQEASAPALVWSLLGCRRPELPPVE